MDGCAASEGRTHGAGAQAYASSGPCDGATGRCDASPCPSHCPLDGARSFEEQAHGPRGQASCPSDGAHESDGQAHGAMDGAHPSMDGAYAASDGAHSSMDGAHGASDGAHPSEGRRVWPMDGAYGATDGAHPSMDGAHPSIGPSDFPTKRGVLAPTKKSEAVGRFHGRWRRAASNNPLGAKKSGRDGPGGRGRSAARLLDSRMNPCRTNPNPPLSASRSAPRA